jgi:hypothetical protein
METKNIKSKISNTIDYLETRGRKITIGVATLLFGLGVIYSVDSHIKLHYNHELSKNMTFGGIHKSLMVDNNYPHRKGYIQYLDNNECGIVGRSSKETPWITPIKKRFSCPSLEYLWWTQ